MKIFKILFLLLSICYSAQIYKDTLYGNPKYVREYVVFLTEIQNPQLLYNSDYGHEGFLGNIFTKKKFKDIWFNFDFVYYINYEQYYKKYKNELFVKENWFYKDNSFLSGFSERYDRRNRLILKINDSINEKHSRKTEFFYRLFNPKRIEQITSPISKHQKRIEYYFKKHKKSKVSVFVNNKKILDSLFLFDEKNNLKEVDVLHKSKWKLIKNNNLCFCPDSLGVMEIVHKNFYDNRHNLIVKENYKLVENNINFIMSKDEFAYNEKNQIISEKRYYRERKDNSDEFELKNNSEVVYEYTNEKLHKKNHFFNGKLISGAEYFYEGDNIVKVNFFENNKTSSVNFRYKFDRYKNWIEIVKSVNGKDLYIWKRDIQYY